MNIPADLRYSSSHEWVKSEDGKIIIGLTDFAQDSMGEVVYVELPELDDELVAGESFAEAESVKAVSEVYSPVNGTVVRVNEALVDNPALVNEDPYGTWLIEAEGEIAEALLDAEAYRRLCEQEA